MIFETHAHYDDDAFDIDREELLTSFPKQGIDYVVNVSAELKNVDKVLALADRYPFIYASVGIHPSNTADLNEESFAWLKERAKHPKNVAIGEIGLDYYWDTPDRAIQKIWFERQMELARELEFPMIIHSRDAANDTYQMMKEAKAGEIGAIIHCFGYGVEQAKHYLDMGFYLGIGGVLTFTNGKKLKEVVEYAPLDRLVLETDSPYLAPVPFRGKRNNSLYLTYVVEEIARLKNIDTETVLRITDENAKRFYRLKEQE
jgi:TatD DNase family protein